MTRDFTRALAFTFPTLHSTSFTMLTRVALTPAGSMSLILTSPSLGAPPTFSTTTIVVAFFSVPAGITVGDRDSREPSTPAPGPPRTATPPPTPNTHEHHTATAHPTPSASHDDSQTGHASAPLPFALLALTAGPYLPDGPALHTPLRARLGSPPARPQRPGEPLRPRQRPGLRLHHRLGCRSAGRDHPHQPHPRYPDPPTPAAPPAHPNTPSPSQPTATQATENRHPHAHHRYPAAHHRYRSRTTNQPSKTKYSHHSHPYLQIARPHASICVLHIDTVGDQMHATVCDRPSAAILIHTRTIPVPPRPPTH